jgi:hypothetical protein
MQQSQVNNMQLCYAAEDQHALFAWRPATCTRQHQCAALNKCCTIMYKLIIIIINPCKPYLTASAPRLTHWGGGK